MSIHRRAAKRDGNERLIVEALRQVGATVQQLSVKGAPDLLVGFRARTYLLETKTNKGRLTPAQVEWRLWWSGHEVTVVRSVDEALRAIGAME